MTRLIQPFLFALICASLLACTPMPSPPRATRGVLDLRQWDFESQGPVKLDGEWEFYWQQLLTPPDLKGAPRPAVTFRLPGVWNGYPVEGQPLTGEGFATFGLRVLLPRSGAYSVKLPALRTAYRLWVDDTLVATSGLPGKSASETRTFSDIRIAVFDLQKPEAELLLQIANFSWSNGGPNASLLLGPVAQIRQTRERQLATDAILMGCFTIIGFYHLSLYLLRRQERATLSLASFCLFFTSFRLVQGELLLTVLWPTVSFEIGAKLALLGLYLILPAFATYLYDLYPHDTSHRALRLIQGGGAALALCVLLLPARFFSRLTLPLFPWFAPLALSYLSYVVLTAYRRGRDGAGLLLSGYLVLALTGVVDLYLELTSSAQFVGTTPLGLLALIMVQALILSRKSAAAYATVEALAQQLSQLNQAYHRFVPEEFLRLLGQKDILAVQLGDQTQREMTVMFVDVREFTALSERMSPEENFTFINTLLGGLSPLVREYGGFIDKYLGDGVMALFPPEPEAALRAALAMQRRLGEFNEERQQAGQPGVRIGIGIHRGTLMLGTVGEPERMDGTVIADVVNTAARLESLTKRFGVTLVVSQSILDAIPPDQYRLRRLGTVRPKGKQEPVILYEVFDGDPPESIGLKQQSHDAFEEGLREYQHGSLTAAYACFEQICAINPQDTAARYYLQQCASAMGSQRPGVWDGAEPAWES